MQNSQKKEIMNNKRIGFWSSVVYADKMWFVSNKYDFMCMDVKTGYTEYVDWKECQKKEVYAVSDKMLVYHTSIYWIDFYRKYVHEYNLESNEYHKYPVIEIQDADIHNEYIIGMYIYKDAIWFFFKSILQVAKFDLNQKKWETYSLLCDKQTDNNSEGNQKINVCSAQIYDEVYLFQNEGKLLKLKLDTFESECVELPNELSGAVNVIWRDKRFYILTYTGNVYIWNEETGTVQKVYHCLEEKRPFGTIAATEHKIFLLPHQAEKILIVDQQNQNEVTQAECPSDLQYTDSIYAKYSQYTEDSLYLWFDNRRSNYILRINKESEQIEWVKPQLPTAQDEWIFFGKRDKDFVLHEEAEGLKQLMCMKTCNQTAKADKDMGTIIWNALTETGKVNK